MAFSTRRSETIPPPPFPTPVSTAAATSRPRIGKAPIYNPYDKFTQPEFDAFIGDITGALRRALGYVDTSKYKDTSDATSPGLEQSSDAGTAIISSDNEAFEDSFAEYRARHPDIKGKGRDLRDGPGFYKGQGSFAEPIDLVDSDEESVDQLGSDFDDDERNKEPQELFSGEEDLDEEDELHEQPPFDDLAQVRPDVLPLENVDPDDEDVEDGTYEQQGSDDFVEVSSNHSAESHHQYEEDESAEEHDSDEVIELLSNHSAEPDQDGDNPVGVDEDLDDVEVLSNQSADDHSEEKAEETTAKTFHNEDREGSFIEESLELAYPMAEPRKEPYSGGDEHSASLEEESEKTTAPTFHDDDREGSFVEEHFELAYPAAEPREEPCLAEDEHSVSQSPEVMPREPEDDLELSDSGDQAADTRVEGLQRPLEDEESQETDIEQADVPVQSLHADPEGQVNSVDEPRLNGIHIESDEPESAEKSSSAIGVPVEIVVLDDESQAERDWSSEPFMSEVPSVELPGQALHNEEAEQTLDNEEEVLAFYALEPAKQDLQLPDPWQGPRMYAEDFYSGGDRIDGQTNPNLLGDEVEPIAIEGSPAHDKPSVSEDSNFLASTQTKLDQTSSPPPVLPHSPIASEFVSGVWSEEEDGPSLPDITTVEGGNSPRIDPTEVMEPNDAAFDGEQGSELNDNEEIDIEEISPQSVRPAVQDTEQLNSVLTETPPSQRLGEDASPVLDTNLMDIDESADAFVKQDAEPSMFKHEQAETESEPTDVVCLQKDEAMKVDPSPRQDEPLASPPFESIPSQTTLVVEAQPEPVGIDRRTEYALSSVLQSSTTPPSSPPRIPPSDLAPAATPTEDLDSSALDADAVGIDLSTENALSSVLQSSTTPPSSPPRIPPSDLTSAATPTPGDLDSSALDAGAVGIDQSTENALSSVLQSSTTPYGSPPIPPSDLALAATSTHGDLDDSVLDGLSIPLIGTNGFALQADPYLHSLSLSTMESSFPTFGSPSQSKEFAGTPLIKPEDASSIIEGDLDDLLGGSTLAFENFVGTTSTGNAVVEFDARAHDHVHDDGQSGDQLSENMVTGEIEDHLSITEKKEEPDQDANPVLMPPEQITHEPVQSEHREEAAADSWMTDEQIEEFLQNVKEAETAPATSQPLGMSDEEINLFLQVASGQRVTGYSSFPTEAVLYSHPHPTDQPIPAEEIESFLDNARQAEIQERVDPLSQVSLDAEDETPPVQAVSAVTSAFEPVVGSENDELAPPRTDEVLHRDPTPESRENGIDSGDEDIEAFLQGIEPGIGSAVPPKAHISDEPYVPDAEIETFLQGLADSEHTGHEAVVPSHESHPETEIETFLEDVADTPKKRRRGRIVPLPPWGWQKSQSPDQDTQLNELESRPIPSTSEPTTTKDDGEDDEITAFLDDLKSEVDLPAEHVVKTEPVVPDAEIGAFLQNVKEEKSTPTSTPTSSRRRLPRNLVPSPMWSWDPQEEPRKQTVVGTRRSRMTSRLGMSDEEIQNFLQSIQGHGHRERATAASSARASSSKSPSKQTEKDFFMGTEPGGAEDRSKTSEGNRNGVSHKSARKKVSSRSNSVKVEDLPISIASEKTKPHSNIEVSILKDKRKRKAKERATSETSSSSSRSFVKTFDSIRGDPTPGPSSILATSHLHDVRLKSSPMFHVHSRKLPPHHRPRSPPAQDPPPPPPQHYTPASPPRKEEQFKKEEEEEEEPQQEQQYEPKPPPNFEDAALSTQPEPIARVESNTVAPASHQPIASTSKSPHAVTRSNCRYHKISLPRNEEGARVFFLVPGCSLVDTEFMEDEEIQDHGDATTEDAQRKIDDIENLDFDPYLIGNLRHLVGLDLLREQEVYYLPMPGEEEELMRQKAKDKMVRPRLSSRNLEGVASPTVSSRSPLSVRPPVSVAGSTSTISHLRFDGDYSSSSQSGSSDSETSVDDDRLPKRPKLLTEQLDDQSSTQVKVPKPRKARRKRLRQDAAEYKPAKDEESEHTEEEKTGRHKSRKKGLKRARTEDKVVEDESRQLKKARTEDLVE